MGVEVERKWKRADYREPGSNGNGLVQIRTAGNREQGTGNRE